MYKRSITRLISVSAAYIAFGIGNATQASPLTVSGWASNPNGYETFNITTDTTNPTYNNQGVNAGGFTGTFNALSILFWCYELDQYFSGFPFSGDYTAGSLSGSAGVALSKLFTEVFAGAPVATPIGDDLSAAIQLAVWEIKYDTGNGPYSLSAGHFLVNSGPGGTITTAQNLLDNLGSQQLYDVTLLHSESNQDFVTGSPRPQGVPEPSPLPLLGAALGAMLITMRRQGFWRAK